MQGLIVPPGLGRRIVTKAQEMTFKVTGADGAFASVFEVVVPPGFDSGAHWKSIRAGRPLRLAKACGVCSGTNMALPGPARSTRRPSRPSQPCQLSPVRSFGSKESRSSSPSSR